MIKQELIEKVAAQSDMPQAQVAQVVDNLLAALKCQFTKGDSVILRGFGTFKVVEVKQKVGRDISKGTPIILPAHRAVKFQPSKELKQLVKDEK